jgi:hypothetical protein
MMLFTYRSPTLAEIAQPLLKESINLYAEAFMRLNTDKGAFPTNDAALEGLRKRLTAWGVPEGQLSAGRWIRLVATRRDFS